MLVLLLQFRNLEVGCCHSINLKYVSEVVKGKKTDGSSWNDGVLCCKVVRHFEKWSLAET